MREKGKLAEGVPLERGDAYGYISTDMQFDGLPRELDFIKADNRILGTAMALQKAFPSASVELITKDINLRIKADVFGINAKDYDPEETVFEDMYTGLKEVDVEPELIDKFYKEKS